MRNRLAPHIDFTELQGVIKSNPKLLPSNVDGIIERNGHFLVMEWKRLNESMNEGQKILLRSLSNTPKMIVLLIEGDTDNGMNVSKIYKIQNDKLIAKGHCLDDLKWLIQIWYDHANKR